MILKFLFQRGARAYLDINCSHCHNPDGWEESKRQFDFRYNVPISQSGIPAKKEKISRTILNRKMPLIGTTMLDEEGVTLILDYLKIF